MITIIVFIFVIIYYYFGGHFSAGFCLIMKPGRSLVLVCIYIYIWSDLTSKSSMKIVL